MRRLLAIVLAALALGAWTHGYVAPVIPTCSGTGLDFSKACNSQYLGIGMVL